MSVIRRAEPGDMRAAFSIFRRSIIAYVHRLGIVDSPLVTEGSVDEAWIQRGPWVEHLWRNAAENWLAVDDDGRAVGWAMSSERGELLELAFFFVDPDVQSKGMGKALLERAFPLGRGAHRAILATQDPRALSLYLRFGVRFVTTVVDFVAAPRPVEVASDLVFERLARTPESVALIGSVEEEILGHRRDVDIEFVLGQRPAWIARRAGAVAGFAFGAADELTGPIGALDPADIPALLAHVETQAAADGIPEVYFSTPLANDTAVKHLLGRGHRIDPFFAALLADDHSLRLDRWIHTGLSYIL